jgi:hypothetical protein
MFTIITNYKKMFFSFIRNDFAEVLSADDFNQENTLSDLKALNKAIKD